MSRAVSAEGVHAVVNSDFQLSAFLRSTIYGGSETRRYSSQWGIVGQQRQGAFRRGLGRISS